MAAVRKPEFAELKQLPVYGAPAPDRVYMLEVALASLEQGQLQTPALLVDSMMRDDRISGAVRTLIDSVLGSELELTPGKDTARGRKIAETTEDSWGDMHPTGALGQMVTWGLMLNVALAERIWDTTATPWTYTLRVWHPQFLHYDWMRDAYFLTTADGQIEIDPASPQWWLFTPRGSQWAYMHGLVRALAKPWMIRQWTARDWARYNEVHGLPLRKAKVPQEASDLEKQRFYAAIVNLANEPVVRLPVNQEGIGFDVELLEAMGNSWEGFQHALEWADKCIAITVNGQSMSTEGQGGLSSQEKPGEAVRGDVKRWVASSLADSMRQGLRQLAMFNYGDEALAVIPSWAVEPPEDAAKKALEYKTLADAIASFKASGAPIDVRHILGDAAIPMLDESEVEATQKPDHPGFIAPADPMLPDGAEGPSAGAEAITAPDGSAKKPPVVAQP